MKKPTPAKLILSDGSVLNGFSIGAKKNTVGELVFNTSMTGYLETLTDPSFFNQIVVQTFPSIGNYGVCSNDKESEKPWVNGLILNNICNEPANFRNEESLTNWLEKNEVAAIGSINTRLLTKKIRDGKVKNCAIIANSALIDEIETKKIITNLLENFQKLNNSLVEHTSIKTIKKFTELDFDYSNSYLKLNAPKIKKTNFKICAIDFGTKMSIIKNLACRCQQVLLVPHNTTPKQIKKINPDGIVLTNGPGDPAANEKIITNIKELQTYKIPTFGICLGHQLLALANGFKTTKLKFGHRGSNQPVFDLTTKKMFITSQNHGYVVDSSTVNTKIAKTRFINLNDNTCEGLIFLNFPIFSVQFHPEACAGPNDTNFLFDEFFNFIEKFKTQNEKSKF